MKTTRAAASAFALAFALTGCGNSKDASKGSFKAAIQAYLDTTPGACVSTPGDKMPAELAKNGFNKSRLKQADALVEAGLLSRTASQMPLFPGSRAMEPSEVYALTETGKKYLVKGASGNMGNWDGFCAGKYKVVEVVNFTDPADAFGTKLSQANFRYVVDEPADWSKASAIQAAFPEFAKDFHPQAIDKAVLISTSDGWMHERLFKSKDR